ncbi:MAG: hypothetical protein LBK28_07855 [Propionibacteriaceae bacterium]|jgi:hypothetical protein|nr:hypothetical protein [Propionibacteriaceae bacterium]
MSQLLAALDASWRILLVGILLGAGLPAVFAFGIRALAWGSGGEAEDHAVDEVNKPSLPGRLVAYSIFTLVVLMVLIGIGYIAAHGMGWVITFDGIMPVFTHK